ncbi:fluoride efflux transporter FluC [Gephyromycinifex aptenodytis]|uniref:fluoride efflux transporter FluC n=1 Tax=Gephyromycinifex aptenodytis TaxID=2716227 RepID=UPI001B2FE3D9|nr:CrcB family protein [Gephyromycinifex aptenodytis]
MIASVSVLLVAAGAALGAPARFVVDRAVTAHTSSELPWGTLLVNVVGSFLLGVVAHVFATTGTLIWGVGFCGSFTTYSTLAAQTWELAGRHRGAAVLNIGCNVVACVFAVWGGLGVGLLLAR